MTDSPRVDRFMELLYRKDFFGRKHNRATVNAAFDEWIGATPKPRKQATPPAQKETKQVSDNSDIATAVDVFRLMAGRGTWKSYDELHPAPRSVNDGAVAAIFKAMENPVDQMLNPIVPGYREYRAPVPTYGDDGPAPTSQGFDPSIQNPMKGWSTLDACLYRKQMAADAEQNRRAELDRLRIR